MIWDLIFLPEADDDFNSLDRRQKIIVDNAIKKIQTNPLPQSEGGYGKPLGHKKGRNLTGFFKIKLKGEGIRIVYRLIKIKTKMLVVVIGLREDEEVYEIAAKRMKKYNL